MKDEDYFYFFKKNFSCSTVSRHEKELPELIFEVIEQGWTATVAMMANANVMIFFVIVVNFMFNMFFDVAKILNLLTKKES